MILKLKQRYALLNILDHITGSFALVEEAMKLVSVVKITLEDEEKYKIEDLKNGNVQWQEDLDIGKEIELSVELLKTAVDCFKAAFEKHQSWTKTAYGQLELVNDIVTALEVKE